MRILRNILLSLVTALGVVAFAPAPSANAATAWVLNDINCTTTGSGLACVRIDKVVGKDTYRARTELTPVVGKWIQPDSYGIAVPNAGGGYPYCSSTCGRATQRWVSSWASLAGNQIYTATVKSASGTHSVTAGDTGWVNAEDAACRTHTAGKVCVQPQIRIQDDRHRYRSAMTITPAKGKGGIAPRKVGIEVKPAAGYKGVSNSLTTCVGPLCIPWITGHTFTSTVRYEGIYNDLVATAKYDIDGKTYTLTR